MSIARRALLLSSMLVPVALPIKGQPATVPSWLEELMQRLSQIPASESDFIEDKHLAALDRPLRSQGRLIYRRPAYLEKITTSPNPETLIVDGDQLVITEGNGPAKALSLTSQPTISGLVEGIRAALAGNLPVLQGLYRIQAQGSPEMWRLELTPFSPPLTRVLRDMMIDGGETAIHTIQIDQTNGDSQIMTITVTR